MRPEIPSELIEGAARVIYACRPWSESSRGMQMACADCGSKVALTPTVLADRRRQVHALHRSLAIVCDDCAAAEISSSPATVALMPSADEIASANR